MTDDQSVGHATDHPLHALINPPMPPVQELAKLREALERAAEEAGQHLQDHVQAEISLGLSELKTVPASEAFADTGEGGISGLFHAADWGAHLVIYVARAGIDTLVDALFGGDGSEAPPSSDGRLSLIQNSTAGFMLALFAKGLEVALDDILPTHVKLQRLDQRVEFGEIGEATTPVVAAAYTLTIFEHAHDIVLVVAESAITPFRSMFEASDTDFGRPNTQSWQHRMRAEISRLLVPLRTVLDETAVPLNDLANLATGTTLPLKATTESLAIVECEGKPLFRGRIDNATGVYTVHIEERLGTASGVAGETARTDRREAH